MEEKKLVPRRRFRDFNNNKFPQTEYLGGLTDIKTGPFGSSLHARDYVEDGIPIITTEHFKEGYLPENKQGIPQVSSEDYLRLNAYRLQIGDIVFSRVGSVDINALTTNIQDGWLFSGRVLRVRPQEHLSSLYLHYLLDTKRVRQDIVVRAVGQTMPSINTGILNETEILITNNSQEQQKIGEFFKVLDERITNQERKIAKVKALKSAYLTEMFPREGETVPKRRFKGFEGEWKKHLLKELIVAESKGKVNARMLGGNTPYLETEYLNGGNISYVNAKPDVELDDVIILWDGSNAGMVYHGFEGALGSTLKVYKPKYSGSFLYYFLKKYQETISNEYRTPNIPHVINTFVDEFEVVMPELKEQQKVGTFFKNLDDQITTEEKKLEKLKKMKEAYLEEMFV